MKKNRTISTTRIFVAFLFSLFLFVAFVAQADSGDYFYYGFDDKIVIDKVNDKILVKKKTTQSQSEGEQLIKNSFGRVKGIEWQGEDLCKIELDDLSDKGRKTDNLLSDNNILSVRELHATKDGLEFGFVDEIIVKFKENVSDADKEKLLASFKLERSRDIGICEVYTIHKVYDILEVANRLYETGFFEFAYPNIIGKIEFLAKFPNDPYFQHQITCHNTGQMINGHFGEPDADIDAPEAWAITTGSNNIVIAVFDEGVTSNHPDLPNTRQVRINGSNFGSGNADNPSPTGDDNHGNACAGVIAATMDNNEGIAGIAPNCKIMPIRWDGTTTSVQIAEGIKFAADNGANIISNSWGYATSNNNYVPAIVVAIQYAINKGVIVVFAAGNTAAHSLNQSSGYVCFPANADVSGLITVGASDRYDKQADYSPTSSLIDIVAPSHRAYPYPYSIYNDETFEMWSLDIPGSVGYNPWPSSGMHPPATGELLPDSGTNYLAYTGRFGGTSHACPVVAGVAALVLSINPYLTPQEVYNILTGTADKVGNYIYSNGKCNEMGFGRVNAYAAVTCAKPVEFTNQQVSANTTVEGCDVVVEDVEVTNNAKLILEGKRSVKIKGPFKTQSGSQLEVKTTPF